MLKHFSHGMISGQTLFFKTYAQIFVILSSSASICDDKVRLLVCKCIINQLPAWSSFCRETHHYWYVMMHFPTRVGPTLIGVIDDDIFANKLLKFK